MSLIESGDKFMSAEGNMGDEREFDEAATTHRRTISLESLELENLKDL